MKDGKQAVVRVLGVRGNFFLRLGRFVNYLGGVKLNGRVFFQQFEDRFDGRQEVGNSATSSREEFRYGTEGTGRHGRRREGQDDWGL